MPQFDHVIVFLKRPITVKSVAVSLEIQAFELLLDLVALEIFVAPPQKLTDDELQSLGDRIGVDFRIDENDNS